MSLVLNETNDVDDIITNELCIINAKDDETKIPVYKIRINYKSGISEEMWVLEFNTQIPLTKIDYKALSLTKTSIYMNVDAIESIYQVGIAFIDKNDFDRMK